MYGRTCKRGGSEWGGQKSQCVKGHVCVCVYLVLGREGCAQGEPTSEGPKEVILSLWSVEGN